MLNIYNANNHDAGNPEPAAVPPKKANFQKYQDSLDGFSSGELKYGLWYVQHRVALYRLLIFILIGISAVLFAVAGVKLGLEIVWMIGDKGQFDRSLAVFPNYTVLHEHFAPQQLEVLSTDIFPGSSDKYDLVSEVVNTNTQWIAEIDYHFLTDGGPAPSSTTRLLPGDDRPVVTLGFGPPAYPANATLVIDAVRWTRLGRHQVTNPTGFQANRLGFTVSEPTFVRAGQGAGAAAHSITFPLTNTSAYTYAQPSFLVGLYLSDTLVGVAPLHFDTLASQETKQVDLRSFAADLTVTAVRIFPLINVYDPEAYVSPGTNL